MDTTLLSAFLPSGILEYFSITSVDQQPNRLDIHLEEKNVIPEEYSADKLKAKGFYDPIQVQDFPIRGKATYLQVKRRRWDNLTTGTVVSRNWNLVAQGTRMTQEFAAFLKGITR